MGYVIAIVTGFVILVLYIAGLCLFMREEKPEDIICPRCGYYCLGKGGNDCIDKPTMLKH